MIRGAICGLDSLCCEADPDVRLVSRDEQKRARANDSRALGVKGVEQRRCCALRARRNAMRKPDRRDSMWYTSQAP